MRDLQISFAMPGSADVLRLDSESAPYPAADFHRDTLVLEKLTTSAGPSGDGLGEEDADRVGRILTYFRQCYGASDGARRFLRFGAVHEALGTHAPRLEAAGLMNAAEPGGVDPDLLARLLAAPLTINVEHRTAWIARPDVDKALARAAGIRRS